MSEIIATVVAPAVKKIYDAINLFVQDSWPLRKAQAENAARANYFEQGTLALGVVLNIPQAQQSDQTFSYLLFTTETTSGEARYMINGTGATATRGFQIPAGTAAGGFTILIRGHENIKGFTITPTGATAVVYTYNLFQ